VWCRAGPRQASASAVKHLGIVMRELLPSPARPGPWLWPDPLALAAHPGSNPTQQPLEHPQQAAAEDMRLPPPAGFVRAASAAWAARQCRGERGGEGGKAGDDGEGKGDDSRCYDSAWVAAAMGAYYPHISFFVCNTSAGAAERLRPLQPSDLPAVEKTRIRGGNRTLA
jgi:hypothetical protein